jgi:serine/threonine protein kinase
LEILKCLGRGGMGVVYKARQKALNRFVALKILAPERSTDPGFAERFTAEARTLASLNHPNIVTIHDFGESGGFYHLVMEYVDGVNLRQAMTAGRFTPEQALAIVPPVCEALQYAHDHGVVHRDIKPENLLLDQQGDAARPAFGLDPCRLLSLLAGTRLRQTLLDALQVLEGFGLHAWGLLRALSLHQALLCHRQRLARPHDHMV